MKTLIATALLATSLNATAAVDCHPVLGGFDCVDPASGRELTIEFDEDGYSTVYDYTNGKTHVFRPTTIGPPGTMQSETHEYRPNTVGPGGTLFNFEDGKMDTVHPNAIGGGFQVWD